MVYGNCRKSRDPPRTISGDETITRLYSKRATDIRMRTSKKNESGILNQNLCGANDEYDGWQVGDPVGSGFTFANLSYPGKTLAKGSMFRERDMGNLVQLLFMCGEYFRGKNVELVTDSNFGHLVPIVYLRMLKVYATSSFNQAARIGISNIKELSRRSFSETELKKQKEKLLQEPLEIKEARFDPLAETCPEEIADNVQPYAKPKSRRKYIRLSKTPLVLFEKELSLKPRGEYRVWKSSFRLGNVMKGSLYLHAVKDSKPVFVEF